MEGGSKGQTTVPSARSQADEADGAALAIRWVFPTIDGEVTRIGGQSVVLGRGEDCDVTLAGTETSRHHAEIVRDGPIIVVNDLGSTNGVHVNGSRVQRAPISKGDVMRLGDWVGVVVGVDVRSEASAPAFGREAERLYVGPALRAALVHARDAACSDLPVVLEGETGTGKERVARAIHAWSGRAGPFVALNCAAMPEAIAEAELFGYRRGAFTGADRASPGHFRSAEGGTLLLDEIADLPVAVQGKLLRVLEEHEVLPLGESRPVPVNVRVLVACQEPLHDDVQARRFRADLFARLEGVTVRLPPLRDRVEEVPYLFARMLSDHAGGRPPPVEARMIEALCLHDWPFNVRELDLLVRRLLTLHGHQRALRRAQLPDRMLARQHGSPKPTDSSVTVSPRSPQGHAERRERELDRLLHALRQHRGNVARAAAEAGVSRQRAYRLMEACAELDLSALRQGDISPSIDSRSGGTPSR